MLSTVICLVLFYLVKADDQSSLSILQLGASKTQSMDADSDDDSSKDGVKKNAMTEMFADKKVRLLVVSTLVLQVANQFSG